MWALCVILALGGQVQGIWKTRNIINVQVGVALVSSGDKEAANGKSEFPPPIAAPRYMNGRKVVLGD